MSDRLGGDRRAIFFVIAAAVSAAMIPLTPTDPAKIDAVTKKVTKPAYSFQYVPMVLIGWCLLLAVLSWLDNRVRLRQKLPIQPVVKPAGPPTYNGLAVTSVVVGGLSLAALVTWGGGLWGIASALAVIYAFTARHEIGGRSKLMTGLAVIGGILGVIGAVVTAWWIARWLGTSISHAVDKLRSGDL